MAGKRQKPRFPLPEAADDANPWGADGEWTEAGVDRLFLGDRIRIRQMSSATGMGSHGQRETLKVLTAKGRKIHMKREEIVFGEVISVGTKNGRPTVYYRTDEGSKTSGGSLGVANYLADNEEPIGWRVREVRRLTGFGPDDGTRASTDPVEHTMMSRAFTLEDSLNDLGEAGWDRLLAGDTAYGKDKEPVTRERIERWIRCTERVPAWAMSAMNEMLDAEPEDRVDEVHQATSFDDEEETVQEEYLIDPEAEMDEDDADWEDAA